ncbi:MAG: nitroreductase [Ignavibacteria bacterium]|nr:nitroreductase [Ignavibacteria bacterium]
MTLSHTTKNELHELISKRFSPKNFSPKEINYDIMKTILEAGRSAPSSFNQQPWRFIITQRNDESFEKLLRCLSPKNAEWAKNAGALILSVAKKKFDHNGSENRHAVHDVGLAVAAMVFQALTFDIFSHQMGGFSSEKAKTTFNIPDDHEPVAVIAFGYLDKDYFTDEKLKQKFSETRNRIALENLAFKDSWGNSFLH